MLMAALLQPDVLPIWVFVLGLLVGSFLNVLVYRLPIMMFAEWRVQARAFLDLPEEPVERVFNLMWPRSECPHCGHTIRAWHNLPVLGWLLLRARCADCRQPISARYPLVELATGFISGGLAWYLGAGPTLWLMLLLSWALLAMSLIDFDHHLLPDSLVLPLLWVGLVANAFEVFTTLESALWGAVAGYLSLWSVYWLFRLLTGREGMGHGDFKLLALLGAWGGWQILPLVQLMSSVLGAVLGSLWLRWRGATSGTPIPFGPFLSLSGWVALLWGSEITRAYLQFAHF